MPGTVHVRDQERELDKKVEEILDRRVREKLKALMWAAGGIVALLVVLRLTVPTLLLMLLGQALGGPLDTLVDKSVKKHFQERAVEMVSYSYATQFDLDGAERPFDTLPFYLEKGQSAQLIVDVLHTVADTARALDVSFVVDDSGREQPLGNADGTNMVFNLSGLIEQSTSVREPTVPNLHTLTFKIDPLSGSAEDRVHIGRCVINVKGWELGGKP